MRLPAMFVLMAGLMSAPALADDLEQRAAASRETAQRFMDRLKTELQAALRDGGPANAIEVCKTKAPQIAAEISREKGWRVARTSLKLRNPNNAPDAWELGVLVQFEARKAAGEDPVKLEHAEVVKSDGKKEYRYMKAIPTADLCLQCHGTNLKPEVQVQLSKLYPKDKATGLKTGDIRGAFTVVQKFQ